MSTVVYQKYLLGLIKYQRQAKTSEITELEQLQKALQLDNVSRGEAHFAAADEWYRTATRYVSDEELGDKSNPERQSMDKLLFLTERVLRLTGEEETAFLFEMSRVAKTVGLTLEEATEQVDDVKEEFYKRALQSTRSKLGQGVVNPGMLERARETLGVDEKVSIEMHVDALAAEVRSLLGLPQEKEIDDNDFSDDEPSTPDEPVDLDSLKFATGSKERLDELAKVLLIPEKDLEWEIREESFPVFQKMALETMKAAVAHTITPDDAFTRMEARREELLMPTDLSQELVSSAVYQALGGPLEETLQFSSVSNAGATYDQLLGVLEAKRTIVSILEKSGWKDLGTDFEDKFCDPNNANSAIGFIPYYDRRMMYRLFMERATALHLGKDGALTEEAKSLIAQVRALLGVEEEEARFEINRTYGPALNAVLQRGAEEIMVEYTPALLETLQKEVNEVVENYDLTDDLVRSYGLPIYKKAVKSIGDKSPTGIPTMEQNVQLDGLRQFFLLPEQKTFASHKAVFGSVYKKSVLEAMAITGIIRPEIREKLEDLRGRLGLSEKATRALYLEAIEDRMRSMIEWISSEMERMVFNQKQLAQRRKKDMGEDVFPDGKAAKGTLGIGAEVNVMRDVMNLIDFYQENEIAEEVVDEEGNNVTVYPITALGMDAVDKEMAEALYRQLVVSSFTEQGPNAARYDKNKSLWAGILGLSEEQTEKINSTIGSSVYDNYVTNSMRTKGTLDQQDIMFIANLQSKLGLSDAVSESFTKAAQKKVLSEEASAMMSSNPNINTLRAFREKCNTMGLDLSDDIGMSAYTVDSMFRTEIGPLLGNGTITLENGGEIISEVAESLGMQERDAQALFVKMARDNAITSLEAIVASLRRGRRDVSRPMRTMAAMGQFLDGDLSDVKEVEELSMEVKNDLISIWQNTDHGDNPTVEEDLEMIKSLIDYPTEEDDDDEEEDDDDDEYGVFSVEVACDATTVSRDDDELMNASASSSASSVWGEANLPAASLLSSSDGTRKALQNMMLQSKNSQRQIQEWERKVIGLKRSHSQTMRNSTRTRQALLEKLFSA
uniref:Uncharacterized protein n=1 Tax=Grammatophora oceanica TaxID=210454 RepID=A0A7S1VF61_9STRA